MLTAYQRVEGGRVVERVKTIDGSNEDTRIGCMVMDKEGGWQLDGTPVEPEPAAPPESPAPTKDPAATEEKPPAEPTSAKDAPAKPKPKAAQRAESEE